MESARSQKPGNQSGTFLHLHEWHAGYHEAFLLKYLKERHEAVLEFFLYFQAIKNHHRSQSQERSNVRHVALIKDPGEPALCVRAVFIMKLNTCGNIGAF